MCAIVQRIETSVVWKMCRNLFYPSLVPVQYHFATVLIGSCYARTYNNKSHTLKKQTTIDNPPPNTKQPKAAAIILLGQRYHSTHSRGKIEKMKCHHTKTL